MKSFYTHHLYDIIEFDEIIEEKNLDIFVIYFHSETNEKRNV